MSIVREKSHSKDFVILHKAVLNDPNLSFKAKGLWAYLMGLPDDWQINSLELAKHSSDGRDSIRNGLRELEQNGYAQKIKPTNDNGQFGKGGWKIFEVKKRLPQTGFPAQAKPAQEKASLLSIDRQSNKKLNIEKDNVRTMPRFSNKKKETDVTRFLSSLTKEQRELHDKLVKYKPKWGDPPKSEDVCAWFLAKKYTLDQVATALKVYQQDAAEAQSKGRTVDNMGGSIVAAIKNRRAPKNQDFEANKQLAKAACKDIREMRVLDKYVSYRIGNDEIQIMYNLPIHTFTSQLGDAKRKLLMECGV